MPDKTVPADIDETPLPRELPAAYAARIAGAKAEKVFAAHPESCVLAADTVVARGRRILPKAETEDQARACLRLLSGCRHKVLTAVAIKSPIGARQTLVTSVVRFKRLAPEDIDGYIATNDWQGKAGGYAIQGEAAILIPFISGSYTNIVGLPLYETVHLLRGLNNERT